MLKRKKYLHCPYMELECDHPAQGLVTKLTKLPLLLAGHVLVTYPKVTMQSQIKKSKKCKENYNNNLMQNLRSVKEQTEKPGQA